MKLSWNISDFYNFNPKATWALWTRSDISDQIQIHATRVDRLSELRGVSANVSLSYPRRIIHIMITLFYCKTIRPRTCLPYCDFEPPSSTLHFSKWGLIFPSSVWGVSFDHRGGIATFNDSYMLYLMSLGGGPEAPGDVSPAGTLYMLVHPCKQTFHREKSIVPGQTH